MKDLTYHDDENELQRCWIELLNEKGANIIIGIYYKDLKKNSKSIFHLKLDDTIKKIKTNNKTEIACGDFKL